MHPRPSALAASGRRRVAFVGLLLALGTTLAACSGGSVTTLSTPPTTLPGLTLTIQRTPAGPILATGTGATLYDFAPDPRNQSTCANVGCVYQWPPLTVSGPIRVGRGVRRGLVSTFTRPGGATQISYDGHPLYTYILDTTPGTVTGQGIDQDGGLWFVLSPAGNEIHTSFTVNG